MQKTDTHISSFSMISGLVFLFALSSFLPQGLGAEGAGEKKAPEEKKEKKDPAKMTPGEAEAAGLCPCRKKEHKLIYHATHGEKKYHFCSRACQQGFKKDPLRFLKGGAPAKGNPKKEKGSPDKKKQPPAPDKKKDDGMDMDEMGGE